MKNTGIREHRSYLILILVFVLASMILAEGKLAAAPIASIPGLFNTGVDDAGIVLPDGSKDPHYQLTLPNPAATKDPFKIPIDKMPSRWFDATGNYAWIGPNAGDSSGPGGLYSYIITFDLQGYNASTAIISGAWTSDNSSGIYLNGEFTNNSITAIAGFEKLFNFALSSSSPNYDFLPGLNSLEFRVNNTGSGPTGLIVADLGGTAEVPVPGSIWLLTSSLIILLGIKKRFRN